MNKFGIGTMRLPEKKEEAVQLIRTAIDFGDIYIDTSRGYNDAELILAEALKNGYRKKVILSSKWSPWLANISGSDEPTEFFTRKRIEESLKRLQVEYLDYFQVWNINNQARWELSTKNGGIVDGLIKAKNEGIVKHIGYTTHDFPHNVLKNIQEQDWMEIILVSYNILNISYEKVLKFAKKKKIKTIIMNPFGGGALSDKNIHLKTLSSIVGAKNIAELALKFIGSNSNIDVSLVGINKPIDVKEGFSFLNKKYEKEKLQIIYNFISQASKTSERFCTNCKYCLPCEVGIDIPSVMKCIFEDKYLDNLPLAKNDYKKINGVLADACISCGKCEERCTQHLQIIESMKYASENY